MLRKIMSGSTIRNTAQAIRRQFSTKPADLLEQGSFTVQKASGNLAPRARDNFALQDAQMRLGMLLNNPAMPTKESVKQMSKLQSFILKLRGIDESAIKKVPQK